MARFYHRAAPATIEFRKQTLAKLSGPGLNAADGPGAGRSRRRAMTQIPPEVNSPAPSDADAAWSRAVPLERLQRDGRAVVKIGGKQIALFATPDGIRGCNNRCPHEGYPLREGTLGDGCVVTCNWHNWKFDLRDGANLLGGDRLRVYPTRIAGDAVEVDVADPPPAARQATALENLRAAFAEYDYERMARELARLAKAGGDGSAAVAAAILWSHDRLEFGATHAYAAAAGWLALHDEAADGETRLVCLTEAIAGIAWDVLREERFAFPAEPLPWSEAAFLAALEAQDEAAAIGRLRGGFAEGLRFAGLERALTRAALAHYADFGHSLIYVVHTGRLIARLGAAVELPLLMALTRSLINASREDLIPEFRAYPVALRDWPRGGAPDPQRAAPAETFRGRSVDATLRAVVAAASELAPEALHRSLLGGAARNLLEFDTRWEARTDGSIAQNVGWLDFTHGLTFANAVRLQCTKFPELWPRGLLQMACFVGRNTGFTTPGDAAERWRVADRAGFWTWCRERISDHGEDRYILAAHLLKTYLAAREEIASGLDSEAETTILAALNRFLNAPLKRKHARRTAHQAGEFVALEY
jgi:nitrite reductase/ring-hydroxylating ferredoxin subunit